MSQPISELFAAIEADADAAAKWLINEVETLATDAVNAIFVPVFKAISPQLVIDAETVVKDLAETAGMAAFDYLTAPAMAPGLMTAFVGRAEAMGFTALAQMEPYAQTVLIGMKTLALKGLADVETALGMPAPIPATSTAPAP